MASRNKKQDKSSFKSKTKSTTEKNQPKHGSKRHKNQKNWQESPEFLEYLKEFNTELSGYELVIRDVQGDGNCLFRSIADQLEGSETLHMHYRNIAVDELKKNKEFYKNFIFDQDFDIYVQEMAGTYTWGGNLEIQAISHALGHNFIIHLKGMPFLAIKGKRVEGIEKKTIHLAFHNQNEGEEHYSSVRNISDASSDEPAEPVKHEKFKSLEMIINKADDENRKEKIAAAAAAAAEKETQTVVGKKEDKSKSKGKKEKQASKGKALKSKKSERDVEKKQINQENGDEAKGEDVEDKVAGEKQLEQKEEIIEVEDKLASLTIEEEEFKHIGRNQKCHCGSLKQYKKCCYAKDQNKGKQEQQTNHQREAIFI